MLAVSLSAEVSYNTKFPFAAKLAVAWIISDLSIPLKQG
jgi:hypothetical protein